MKKNRNAPALTGDSGEPLITDQIDQRNLCWMKLDLCRLNNSDFIHLANNEEFGAAMKLWMASRRQVPAGSLPNNDRILASLSGYSNAPRKWAGVREMALHGWLPCNDGRLYHPVITEMVMDIQETRNGPIPQDAGKRDAAEEKRRKNRERVQRWRMEKREAEDMSAAVRTSAAGHPMQPRATATERGASADGAMVTPVVMRAVTPDVTRHSVTCNADVTRYSVTSNIDVDGDRDTDREGDKEKHTDVTPEGVTSLHARAACNEDVMRYSTPLHTGVTASPEAHNPLTEKTVEVQKPLTDQVDIVSNAVLNREALRSEPEPVFFGFENLWEPSPENSFDKEISLGDRCGDADDTGDVFWNEAMLFASAQEDDAVMDDAWCLSSETMDVPEAVDDMTHGPAGNADSEPVAPLAGFEGCEPAPSTTAMPSDAPLFGRAARFLERAKEQGMYTPLETSGRKEPNAADIVLQEAGSAAHENIFEEVQDGHAPEAVEAGTMLLVKDTAESMPVQVVDTVTEPHQPEFPDLKKPENVKETGASAKTEASESVGNHSANGRDAQRFDEFWKAYPVKVGKKICLKKWKARKLDRIADHILANIAERKEKDQRWLNGFILNPETFINQDRWEDQIQSYQAQKPAPGQAAYNPLSVPVSADDVSEAEAFFGDIGNFENLSRNGQLTAMSAQRLLKKAGILR